MKLSDIPKIESPQVVAVESLNVENSANYEGNMTLLLISRLRNPLIREQVISYLLADAEFKHQKYGGNSEYEKPSRMQIEDRYDKNLSRIESFTVVDYSKGAQSEGGGNGEHGFAVIAPHQSNGSGERVLTSIKQISYTEAHEKGHSIRGLGGEYFNAIFAGTLDSGVTIPEYLIDEMLSKISDVSEIDKLTLKQNIREDGFRMDAFELAERMAQLKNYFGFSGSEVFTKEHLEYAKKHFVKDTGLDNWMSIIFLMITPKVEERFLYVMNHYGI